MSNEARPPRPARPLSGDELADLHEQFDECDIDGDGRVDFTEFAKLLENLGSEVPPAKQRGHFDAVRPQRQDDRVDLVAGQHEIARDGGLPAAGRLEIDANRHAHRTDGRQRHAVLRDRVASLDIKLVDAAVSLAFDADDLVELRRVEIDGRRFDFRKGETIHTESSHKFTEASVRDLAAAAGWTVTAFEQGEEPSVALALLQV